MLSFAAPYALLFLVPLGFAAWYVYKRRIRQGLLFSPVSRIPIQRRSWRIYAANVLPSIILLGIGLSIISLARPRKVFSMVHRATDAIAIMMVVDVSGSMRALDMSTESPSGVNYQTRLDVVKKTFGDFVEQRSGDLIGLVTFGGYASTRCPLTTDSNALLHVLAGVQIPDPTLTGDGQIANQDELLTAIGDAIATACARIKDAEPTSKIIVLLSDGESNTGMINPEKAVDIATELGIKIYTIGVGSTGPAPFWTKDVFGRKVLQYGQVVLDEALLRNIAQQTKGRYFNVRDPKGLQKAMDDIDRLEKTRIQRNEYQQYDELYVWFLLPSLLLVGTGMLLNMLICRRVL